LQDIKNIEAIIQDIKSKIQKETNFNDKVKLNIDLKTQKDKLGKLKEKL
jgi:CCR4-NOT transcriptional regulation complex NOT5 subunit